MRRVSSILVIEGVDHSGAGRAELGRGRSALRSSLLLLVVLGFGALTAACSGGGDSPVTSAEGGAGGAPVVDASGSAGTPAATTGGQAPVDGSELAGAAGQAGATAIEANCSDVDLPDDDFTDSNCDGIDGDAAAAIFVAPSGDDTQLGTMATPVKSIARAIELASADGKDVYLCSATYAEQVVIETTAVNLYGGFDCANGWKRSLTNANIEPGEEGVALTIRDVVDPVVVDRVDVRSKSADTAGGSSIAVLVSNSADIRIAHATIRAGNGASATPPVDTDDTTVRDKALNGESAPNRQCDNANPCTGPAPAGGGYTNAAGYLICSANGGSTRGGRGGDGAVGTATPAGTGQSGTPTGPASGGNGTPGNAGTPGINADMAFGRVTASGYEPTNAGTDGGVGQIGRAGGGGNGGPGGRILSGDIRIASILGGGGGMGGGGGCGGRGGKGGGGGGASIAVLAIDSKLSLVWATLRTGFGGDGAPGGLGAAGGAGQEGGDGGLSSCQTEMRNGTCTRTRAPSGGRGGAGGKGGPGGGGGGGPSIAIVYQGIEPELSAVDAVPGGGGLGGVGVDAERAPQGESVMIKDATNG